MEKFKLIACSLIISLIFISSIYAQDSSYSGIAILPFFSNGIDPAFVQTSESILYVNFEFIYTINDYDDTAIVFTIGIL